MFKRHHGSIGFVAVDFTKALCLEMLLWLGGVMTTLATFNANNFFLRYKFSRTYRKLRTSMQSGY
jgi:hypothetical protein